MQRFVAAVFKHETNTFSPVSTPISTFGRVSASKGPVEGQNAIEAYKGTNNAMAAYIDIAERTELVCPIAAYASPSSPVQDDAFEHCAEAICDSVRKGCDALFLDLHGAMVTDRYDDGEGELLRRIRAIAPDLPIAVALDFHSNLSSVMIDIATVIAGYCTYPHTDRYETGARAGRALLRALRGEVTPVMSWHSLPMLTHMNRQTPAEQPMKDIMDRAMAAEAEGDVLNASIFGGFPLADIPHVGLAAVVVSDGDRSGADRMVYDLLHTAWDRRAEFVYEVEPVQRSLDYAASLSGGPIILADHGENCGAGGSQDVMDVLQAVMEAGLEDVAAGPFCDPESVAQMIDAGVDAWVELQLGGKTDTPAMKMKGTPLSVSGTVRRITDGRFRVTGPMGTGSQIDIGRTAVLDTGKIEIVVSEERFEPMDTGCFTHAGIDPLRKKYVLIKSRQHFRAGLEPIAKHIVMVSGPGCCTSDYSLFPWEKLRRPIYPLDPDTESTLPSQS